MLLFGCPSVGLGGSINCEGKYCVAVLQDVLQEEWILLPTSLFLVRQRNTHEEGKLESRQQIRKGGSAWTQQCPPFHQLVFFLFFCSIPVMQSLGFLISVSSRCHPHAVLVSFQCTTFRSSLAEKTLAHLSSPVEITAHNSSVFLNMLDGASVPGVAIVSLTKSCSQLFGQKLCPWEGNALQIFLFQLLSLINRKTFLSAEGRTRQCEMPSFVSTELRGL